MRLETEPGLGLAWVGGREDEQISEYERSLELALVHRSSVG